MHASALAGVDQVVVDHDCKSTLGFYMNAP